ncbi:TonB-dependent siderophore receptor [Aureimonas sp. Leaf454]|uniref:TonB-dependent siderophore receptor n=1 Tax=Aureimonas sp. Leaf454 TaxID=1736381 RepID=UPI001FCD173C|nr:TonB-dependent siderophore receptor [Aureimonas sp. Leaf454]
MVRVHRPLPTILAGCTALSLLSASAGAQEPIVLDTVTLEGGGGAAAARDPGTGIGGGVRTEGYVAKGARIGTKTDTDLRKVPQAVAVVSREELEDRKVQSLVEAARYTAGVRAGTFGFDPAFDTLFVRGFNVADTGYYRDGLRSLGGTFAVFRHEPYGLDGISILKGPSSVLYGSGAPGGIVNVISKRPTEAPYREIEGQLGSHDRAQVNFDASGPLGAGDNVLYRLTGLERSADTEFVAARDDRTYIAPAFTVRSDDRNTQLTVLGEYTDLKSGGARGFLTLNNRVTDIEQGDPRLRDLDQEQARIGYEFEHRFDEMFTVRQNLRYQTIDTNMRFVSVYGINPGGLTAPRGAGQILDEADGIAVDNQVQAEVRTGEIAHTLLGGLDYTYADTRYRYGAGAAPDLDLLTLNYGRQPISGPVSHDLSDTDTHQGQTGLYLQDQAEYDRFVLTAGLRYDWLDTDSLNNATPAATSRTKDENLSGRVGLAYLFDNGLSPYANYATSFAPTTGRSAGGTPFDPTDGEQVEIGVKYAPEGAGYSVDAALFRIRQSNLLITDPADINFQVQQGAVVSEGFELQASAGIADGLNLVAAYTYTDLTYDAGADDGRRVPGIPHHQFSLWGQYDVLSGPAEGLGLGLGTRFIGPSYADNANRQENESRILVDASLSYDFGALNPKLEGVAAQINAKNVFDQRDETCSTGYCYREEGRNVIGSLRYRF